VLASAPSTAALAATIREFGAVWVADEARVVVSDAALDLAERQAYAHVRRTAGRLDRPVGTAIGGSSARPREHGR
jgi:hypothetical protein